MLISVIIPVYNVEDYISKCIESILNQNYTKIELILVNDGSKDESGKICDKYAELDSRIKVIHKENGGQSSARNMGVDLAKGDYIVFVDSDDFWLDNKLEPIVDKLRKDKPDILLFKGYSYYESTNSYIPFSKEYKENCFDGNGQEVLSNILESDYDFGWCPVFYFIKRQNIIKNNLKFLNGYLCEDVNYVFKLWNISGTVSYYDDYLYAYRRENDNSTTHLASFKFCDDLLNVIKMNLELIEEYSIDGKLKNLIYLNIQTLINVILFWFSKYEESEKLILNEKIKSIRYVYDIDQEYKYLVGKKEKIVSKMIKILNINTVGLMWALKNKIKSLN